MADLRKQISDVAKSDYATAALYAGVIGLALSDILPTPADAFYFHRERKLRDQYRRKEITPSQYWRREAFAYYTYNFAWWVLVGAIVVNTKGSAKKKMYLLSGIIGAGAVVGVLWKNIQQDKIDLAQELKEKEELEKQKQAA